MTVEFILTDAPAPAAREVILRGLDEVSARLDAPTSSVQPLAVLLRDERRDVVGGLWGRTDWGWLSIELLFVPEALRGAGLGRQLVQRAEAEALRRGCHGALVNTFSFQAPGFYESLGYRVFGTLADCPPGHTRLSLEKALAAPSAR